MSIGLGLGLVFVHLFRFSILCDFSVLAQTLLCSCIVVFVVLDLVSSVLRQEIGWEERRLRSDLFCVEWDVKPQLSQPHEPWSPDPRMVFFTQNANPNQVAQPHRLAPDSCHTMQSTSVSADFVAMYKLVISLRWVFRVQSVHGLRVQSGRQVNVLARC